MEGEVLHEFSQKASRLRRLSVRWLGTSIIVLVLMNRFFPLFPPVSAWFVWLSVWAMKGIVDVLEDVAGARDSATTLWAVSSLFGCVLGAILPACHEICLVCASVMVAAAAVSGGIDRNVWRVAGVLVVAGCVVGYQKFSSSFSGRDGQVLLVGAVLFGLLESLQDRFFSSDDSGFWLIRLKLIPTLAVSVIAVLVEDEARLARAVFAFVLCSPHFLVYDAAKLCTCAFLLERGKVHGAGPAVLSQRMRELLLYLLVFLASGRSAVTVRDPVVASRCVHVCVCVDFPS